MLLRCLAAVGIALIAAMPERDNSVAASSGIMEKSINHDTDFFLQLVSEIRRERHFESLLIIQLKPCNDARIQQLYKLSVPQIIGNRMKVQSWKKTFNSDIFAIAIMEYTLDAELLQSLAEALDFMRQTRILLVALNIRDSEELQARLPLMLENYKMTNVLIHLCNSENPTPKRLYRLNPYPQYHLEGIAIKDGNNSFYKCHWRNMHNLTLRTLPDQYLAHSIVYRNSKNELKFNGIAPMLVMTFAKRVNASLELAHEVQPGEVIHMATFVNLTQGLVDLPMSLYSGFALEDWLRMTYPVLVAYWFLMVPRAHPMPTRDIFTIIVGWKLFAYIIVMVMLFSLIRSASDYANYGHLRTLNVIFYDKIVAGLLGQTLTFRRTPSTSMKIIYLLVFLFGLILYTLFAAHLKTLTTALPLRRQLKTLDDLKDSDLQVLFDTHDINFKNKPILDGLGKTIVYTSNTSYYLDNRKTMNTAYGYFLGTATWEVYKTMQEFYCQRRYVTPPGLNIYGLNFAIILEKNSPLKEALDSFIFQVHDAGLGYIWKKNSALDMIKHKIMPLPKEMPADAYKVLNVGDLYWIWVVLSIGLTTGTLAFLSELCVTQWRKKRTRVLNK